MLLKSFIELIGSKYISLENLVIGFVLRWAWSLAICSILFLFNHLLVWELLEIFWGFTRQIRSSRRSLAHRHCNSLKIPWIDFNLTRTMWMMWMRASWHPWWVESRILIWMMWWRVLLLLKLLHWSNLVVHDEVFESEVENSCNFIYYNC